ncbi:MAG: hypothetical protein IIA92_02915 [Chloroflexi bacterium]|nr:hypothetical protein [Chloroflexota bacterium]
MLLADHIYRDQGSSKYVIAGTFHQLNVATFPITFARTIGVFVSLSGLNGKTSIDLEFVDTSSGEVLMRTQSLEVSCDDPDFPVEFAIEVPPLPLPHAGRYLFRLAADGTVVGTVAVSVRAPGEEG